MFDFIRKRQIWEALDAGNLNEITSKLGFQLKTMQDLVVYTYLRDSKNLDIAEIGGGNSRILPRLAKANTCFNIEPFEGADNGPEGEITFQGVKNILTLIGESHDVIPDAAYDVVFSISVVEHIEDQNFQTFYEDCLRILKPGGSMYHAIDMYVSDQPTKFWTDRLDMYRATVQSDSRVTPLGDIYQGELAFAPNMASNPDNVMYAWKAISPGLDALRQTAQSISLITGIKKNQ